MAHASAAGVASHILKILAFVLLLHGQIFAADDNSPRGKIRKSASVVEIVGEEWAKRFANMVDLNKNVGVPPNIEVEQWTADVITGRGPQLEKAIEVIVG
jgi:hypothetical protein